MVHPDLDWRQQETESTLLVSLLLGGWHGSQSPALATTGGSSRVKESSLRSPTLPGTASFGLKDPPQRSGPQPRARLLPEAQPWNASCFPQPPPLSSTLVFLPFRFSATRVTILHVKFY